MPRESVLTIRTVSCRTGHRTACASHMTATGTSGCRIRRAGTACALRGPATRNGSSRWRTGVPVAGDAGVPAILYRNRNHVVATALAAKQRVAVSRASTIEQNNESAAARTLCQPLYSGCVAPDTRTTSPRATPVDERVPVPLTVESALPPLRFTRTLTDPLCTVTVSPLRYMRRDASATVVSVARELGNPPCGAFDTCTERCITTAVNTVPATIDPPMASTDGVPRVPGTTAAATNDAAPVPVGVSETA